MADEDPPEWLLNLRLKRAGLKFAERYDLKPLRLLVESVNGGPMRPDDRLKDWPIEKRRKLLEELEKGLKEMTEDEIRAQLDAAITMASGKEGPFQREAKIAALVHDSLETLEMIIILEEKFERSFEDSEDAPIHNGTYGELLDMLCAKLGVVQHQCGDLDFPAANHFDPSKRGFSPR